MIAESKTEYTTECKTEYKTHGHWLIEMRASGIAENIPNNPYMREAVHLTDMLFTVPELQARFPNIFEDPSRPVLLEVGSYFGHTLVELAEHNRDINVLGVDLKYKRVVKCCHKIRRGNLTNARVGLCDVMEILPRLPEKSFLGIMAFFPDPWTKNRHEKFRYLNETFFNLAASRLVDGGFVWVKTDNESYYNDIRGVVGKCGFSEIDRVPDPIAPREYLTLFEAVFRKQKVPCYSLVVQKNGSREVK